MLLGRACQPFSGRDSVFEIKWVTGFRSRYASSTTGLVAGILWDSQTAGLKPDKL